MPASSAPTASESPAASARAAPPSAIARAPSSSCSRSRRGPIASIAWWAQRPTIRNATTNASATAAVADDLRPAHRLAGRQRGRHPQEDRDGQVLEDQHPEDEVGLVVAQAAQVEERPRDDAAARDVDQPGEQHRLRRGPEQDDPHRQAQAGVEDQVDDPPDHHHPPRRGEPVERELEAQEEQQQHDPEPRQQVDALGGLDDRGEARRGAQQDPRDDEDGDRREPQPSRQHARRDERHQDDGEIAELEQGRLGPRGGSRGSLVDRRGLVA